MIKNRFQFLTYSGFRITTSQGKQILVDPFVDENPYVNLQTNAFDQVDLILATHGAYDHVGDTAKIAKRHRCWVVCPDDVKALLVEDDVDPAQIFAVPWGMSVRIDNLEVKPIENHHRTHVTLRDGRDVSSLPLAFILTLEDDTRVYIAGDTAIFSDMKLQGALYRPHIGLVNVVTDAIELDDPNDGRPHVVTGEMSPYEAALACEWLGLDVVLPCHYIKTGNPQLGEFVEILHARGAHAPTPVQCVALEPLGWFEYSATEGTSNGK